MQRAVQRVGDERADGLGYVVGGAFRAQPGGVPLRGTSCWPTSPPPNSTAVCPERTLAPHRTHHPDSRPAPRRLDSARKQGWAMVNQELENGLRSIAAPVRDANGRVKATMGLSSLIATTEHTLFANHPLPRRVPRQQSSS
ncbi:IclR family transcriptional regulator C-terminal domain-containing protein [Streptomyces sp. NPDC059679]|uniref:IclR family transcriptional regulator domain-containing protein n=1 Tax=Streptomyces sp. NPDC059679 TaxID=3346903 RepID=UPI0036B58EC7